MRKKKAKTEGNKSVPLPKAIRIFIVLISFIILLGLIGYGIILYGGSRVVEEEAFILDETTTIETSEGKVIGMLYNENRNYVPIERIPEHVKNAFIAIEDVRFYEHAGIDFKSVVRAVYKDIIAMSKVEGASTITQQLAKNLFLSNEKTWDRKIKEAMAAIYMETHLSKDRILELYLNEVYFGHGVYGIEVAANYFFSKSVQELSIAEGAMLAGLMKAPNGYSPINHPEKALERRNIVLEAMNRANMISTETKIFEQGKTLGLQIKEKEVYPWAASYIDLVMKEITEKHQISIDELHRGGYRIIVHMDHDIQKVVADKFEEDAYFPGNTEGVQGAFVMMDQTTGKIVAAMGGRDYQLGDLNRVTIRRQPGSTFKPIAVYAPALMQKDIFHPYTLIPDQPKEFGGYVAENADRTYENAVTVYEAIVESKNAPTVWLLEQIGIDYSKKYLQQLGIEIEDEGLAIALGGLKDGVTPMKLVEAYRAFAHGGKTVDGYTIDKIYNREGELLTQATVEEREVFHPQVAWNMTEILIETVNNGTAQVGHYEKALAGKTGSTQHPFVEGKVKDAWFVGYTPEYVMALWVGYDRSDKDHYLNGGSDYPTSLTKAILQEVDKNNPLEEEFKKPDDVDPLPKPIYLPVITDIQADYDFGGFSLVQGKLQWEASTNDDRVIYRIYEKKDGIDELVGEVTGKNEFTIDGILLQSKQYYVVPYDPLTKLEGNRSEVVEFALKFRQN